MQEDTTHEADRIAKLEAALAGIERRLDRVESSIGVRSMTQEPAHPDARAGQPPGTPPTQASGSAVGPSPPLFPFPRLSAELEVLIGTSWLNRLGIIAIIFAVAYFLKYSFDNNWIGPSGRVGLTLLGGGLLLAAGEHYQRRRLSIFAQGLSGGGAAVLYLAIFSAFAIYRLVDFAPAFVTMVLITAATMALALRYDSLAIAALGLLGGFATPFLLGGPAEGGVPRPTGVGTYAYFLLLTAGVYELARRRRWWRFSAVGLAAGFLAPVILAQAALPQPSVAAAYFLLLSVGSLLLSVSFAVPSLAWTAVIGGFFGGPAAGVSSFFEEAPLLALGYYAVITTAAITVAEHHNWIEMATTVAAAGTLFALFVQHPGTSHMLVPQSVYLLLVAGAALIAAARRDWPWSAFLVTLFTGASWTAMAMSVLSVPAAVYPLVGSASALFLLTSVTAALASRTHTELWMQTGVLCALVYAGQLYVAFGGGGRDVLALFAAGIAAYHLGMSRMLMRRPWPALTPLVYLGLAMTFVTIAIPLKLHQTAIPLAWSAEGVVLAWAAVRAGNLWAARASAIVGALVAVRLVFFETPAILTAGRFLFSTPGLAFACGIAALAIAARLLHSLRWPSDYERAIPAALGAVANGLCLWWGGWEIHGQASRADPTTWIAGARHTALSAWLSLYGVGLVIAGVARGVPGVRWAGIGLLAVAILKVLLFDLAELQVVYRIASLMVLGVLLLLASLVYGRSQLRLGRESHP